MDSLGLYIHPPGNGDGGGFAPGAASDGGMGGVEGRGGDGNVYNQGPGSGSGGGGSCAQDPKKRPPTVYNLALRNGRVYAHLKEGDSGWADVTDKFLAGPTGEEVYTKGNHDPSDSTKTVTGFLDEGKLVMSQRDLYAAYNGGNVETGPLPEEVGEDPAHETEESSAYGWGDFAIDMAIGFALAPVGGLAVAGIGKLILVGARFVKAGKMIERCHSVARWCRRVGFGDGPTWGGSSRYLPRLPNGWSRHHWLVPQKWAKALTRGNGLGMRFFNGRWNVMPMPHSWNNALGSGWKAGGFALGVVGIFAAASAGVRNLFGAR
jgi:hypothetical protein